VQRASLVVADAAASTLMVATEAARECCSAGGAGSGRSAGRAELVGSAWQGSLVSRSR